MNSFHGNFRKTSYILWLGVTNPCAHFISGFPSRSAAEYWQQCAINGLTQNSKRIASISHEFFPRWPKGAFYVGANKTITYSSPHSAHITVPYFNLPCYGLRNLSLSANYLSALKRLVSYIGPPIRVLSYNVFPHTLAVANYVKSSFNVKSTFLIADQPARGVFKRAVEFEDALFGADKCAFFSWEMYQRFKDRVPSIHFEGGTNLLTPSLELRESIETDSFRIIMFCGSSSVHSGLQTLLDAIPYLQTPNLHLWITGPISNRVQEICRNIDSPNCTIKVFGLLDNCALEALMEKASIFVNPYSVRHPPNRCNFPSKVLLYLPYLKPIVSTWTAGLSPSYRDILCTVSDDTPSELAKKIDDVLSWDKTTLLSYKSNLSSFVRSNIWSTKVLSLI